MEIPEWSDSFCLEKKGKNMWYLSSAPKKDMPG